MDDNVKRSRRAGMSILDPDLPSLEGRVGGRHRHPPTPAEGGGYLDVCTKNGAPHLADPRVKALAETGLAPFWLGLAEQIGVDLFLIVWQYLDQINIDAQNRDAVRIRVPLYSKYKRLIRDNLIMSLSLTGRDEEEIQQHIKRELCETLSLKHIKRIIKKYRI